MLPKCWRKSFDSGMFIPTKKRFCNECDEKKMCNKCDNQINETKEFEANLKELKKQPLSNFVI